jgi:hypothetical protein
MGKAVLLRPLYNFLMSVTVGLLLSLLHLHDCHCLAFEVTLIDQDKFNLKNIKRKIQLYEMRV